MSPTAAFSFEVARTADDSAARTGVLRTPHGAVRTPLFMPVGTRATVKGVLPTSLAESGSQVLLANTYHLALRPGPEVVRELGGLHRMMAWDGPILTDSGGYQVFSLSDKVTIDADGATLRSIVDGSPLRLTPERVMEIQRDLGADIVMAFDHCPPDPNDREGVERATDRTHAWLARCVRSWRAAGGVDSGQALFGIVQGGAFEDLRVASVAANVEHDLVGYAIGGVSVGEDKESMLRAVEAAAPQLPEEKPRYLMGVGTPIDFLHAVERGIDMFDCVTPTRNGRSHQAFTSRGRVNLRNQSWKTHGGPLDPECACTACTRFPLGALRHLCTTGEMLGSMLVSLHNITFFHDLLERFRSAIEGGSLAGLRASVERAEERCAGP